MKSLFYEKIKDIKENNIISIDETAIYLNCKTWMLRIQFNLPVLISLRDITRDKVKTWMQLIQFNLPILILRNNITMDKISYLCSLFFKPFTRVQNRIMFYLCYYNMILGRIICIKQSFQSKIICFCSS